MLKLLNVENSLMLTVVHIGGQIDYNFKITDAI